MVFIASLGTLQNLRKEIYLSTRENQILGAVKYRIAEMETEMKSLKCMKENPNLNKSE